MTQRSWSWKNWARVTINKNKKRSQILSLMRMQSYKLTISFASKPTPKGRPTTCTTCQNTLGKPPKSLRPTTFNLKNTQNTKKTSTPPSLAWLDSIKTPKSNHLSSSCMISNSTSGSSTKRCSSNATIWTNPIPFVVPKVFFHLLLQISYPKLISIIRILIIKKIRILERINRIVIK